MTQAVAVKNILSSWDGGGAIFSATTLQSDKSVKIVASAKVMPRTPVVGEIWIITGTQKNHPVHGPQVTATTALLSKPAGKLIINTIANGKQFTGIGQKSAAKLWEALGGNIYDELANENHAAFKGILAPELIDILIREWGKLEIESTVYKWLDQHNLPVWLSHKLIILYDDKVIEMMEENPYRLLAFTSWKEADALGIKLGFSQDDERRLVGAVDASIYQALDNSHTWISKKDLLAKVKKLLGCNSEIGNKALKIAAQAHAIEFMDEGIQGNGALSMERYIAQKTNQLISKEYNPTQTASLSDKELENVFNSFELENSIKLNTQQRSAVSMAMAEPLSILTGGAGVGKTTALNAIHKASDLNGDTIIQMALSGRAARRMQEATKEPACTLAKFFIDIDSYKISLEGSPLIIIDEASMLDLPTLYKLFRRFIPGVRLLLVGDDGQLPPIGFGLTFHALVKFNAVPKVELTEIHRQAAETGIPQVSISIRNGIIPKFDEFDGLGLGVSFIEATKEEVLPKVIDVLADMGKDSDVQIVGAIKAGPAGINNLNKTLHQIKNPSPTQPEGFELLGMAVNDPVIWKVNNQDLDLMNGSLGIIKSIQKKIITILWDDNIVRDMTLTHVKDMDLAYAITCHKSQGSQFERVIIPITKSRLLDRTLLYTAITRAKFQVILVGDQEALEDAITSPSNPSLRQTAITYHLHNFIVHEN